MRTLDNSIREYRPAIQLEKVLSRKTMSFLRNIFAILLFLSGAGALVSYIFFNSIHIYVLLGLNLIFASLWLEQIAIFAYHNSYYFKGLNSILGLEKQKGNEATYDVAKAVLKNPNDITLAFCSSEFGNSIMLRAGVSLDEVDKFLKSSRQKIESGTVTMPEEEIFSLIGLGKYLLVHDTGFKKMVRKAGVTEDVFIGSMRWVIGSYHETKRAIRWWSKDNLSKTTGIGRGWSFGVAYSLKRFSKDIKSSAVFSTITNDNGFAKEKILEIESVLARDLSANVLVIGKDGVGKTDIIMEVSKRMRLGQSIDSISGKEIVVLDTNRLFASNNEKQKLELALLGMLNEATKAGNVIIVIESISTFIKEAEALDVFIPDLFDQYLSLPHIQFIFTDTPNNYHNDLEKIGGFVRRFSEVLIDSPDLSATTRVLEKIALAIESKNNQLFTYGGLKAVTSAADRFVVSGVMPDKAVTLLNDVSTKARQKNINIITEDFVYEVASEKTGVPAGPINEEEKDVLLHLEDRLHQQVVGQQKALDSIARTMRRARAGIQDADKPIGSFLFLGPTGVGKTETAKALANIFFNGEDKMQRIDMSEFSGEDALERLIGDGEQSGTLPNILSEHPYCVLLLDEFEKATQSVHDVFLQILDEGIFTDARGMEVNARNTIIIATSNAGSQMIIKAVQEQKNLDDMAPDIINHIVDEGTYRPELLNRFDSTVVFKPLSIEEQTEVASLMLGGLQERITDKGYELKVGNELMKILVEKGYNPEFGARPMKRVLQDVIEEKIAQKIIAGLVQKGETIELNKSDFTLEELSV